MSDSLTLGAYWKPRQESIEQCADRLLSFMRGLTESDITFSQWYRLGHSRQDALKRRVDVQSYDEIFTLLDKGRHRRDIGKTVMEDLGFSVGIWNGGEDEKDVGLHIRCGLYWISPNHNVSLGNCVTLGLPKKLGALGDSSKMGRILAITATCWEPDWAGVFSDEAKDARDWKRKPFVDWMVYVPQKIAGVPPPSTVTHLENGGSVIVVQPNPPSVNNPEDQERIQRIERLVHA
jgi:hypothetical protein